MIPFHRTGYARDLFSNHIPRAVRALESIAKSLRAEVPRDMAPQGVRSFVVDALNTCRGGMVDSPETPGNLFLVSAAATDCEDHIRVTVKPKHPENPSYVLRVYVELEKPNQ